MSERRTQTSSEAFPDEALVSIRSAVDAVPASVFDGSTKHSEIGAFDAAIADGLPPPQYGYEGDATGGYNPNCKLWSHLGFNYSVDLYDADARIGIEVEKSDRKNVSDDLLKFQKGHRTKKDGRPKIEFGCLIVPLNYLGQHNLYQHSLTKLDFMKGVLFIDDVAVIGYRDPRPD
ncbi:hypothetical protein RH831_11595 [Halodesulfurarchaeum sp. HSR-GB]|uniref:hypothetical protein n=1 Tax=Halodesulfurarchaeum sp. HSR-GB TaxID=3074077 RepID=UPI002861B75E|nr:hypothetical protein [Halodesulfurarchaeum sp. HSR-GB]MDR5657814.1 hypothetical protein [Halodesulfurarchaeum sp. HSR-GB]